MTKINLKTNASYNFKAPNIEADENKKIEVAFPTSEAQAVEAAATIPVTVKRQSTVIDLGTLSADGTVNATIGDDVGIGASLLVKAKSPEAAKDITWGTGFSAPDMAGVISKTKAQHFVYDGSTFVATAAAVQLD